MAADPLRLDEEEYRLVYENGYKAWPALMEEAADDPGLPPASLQVEHLFPEHPYFPVGLELDGSGLLTASSTWVHGAGSCDLPSFEQLFQILPYVATPTRLFMSTKAPVPPSAWFKQYDNHLTVLVLAWAYALSARWADIIPQASPLDQSYDKRNADAIVELGVVSDDAARWWEAVLSPGQGWRAFISCGRFRLLSPWSSTFKAVPAMRLSSISRSTSPGLKQCPPFETAVRYIAEYSALHSADDPNRAAFATALMLPLVNFDRQNVLLPVPRMYFATPPSIRTRTSVTPEEPIWGRDLRQFDRLLTLSCNAHGVKSILGSIFYEPGILCNTCGPWLQGTITVLQSRKAGDLDILARAFSLRSPHLSFLWLGAIITGLHKGFLKNLGGLLGLNRIDLHEAAWAGTVLSFVQNPVPQQQESATSISRQDEFTLAFLTQEISRYRFPPIYPYPPPGSTTINDLDLDVRLHIACPGGHGLKFSKNHLELYRREERSSRGGDLGHNIDYTWMDPDRDISELATRNVFMWMRGMDDFPVNEREIYKHEWFGEDDSDDDERNRPEGDVGSSVGCNLDVTVGGWVSGVMAARCNSL
ncbi:hypothetical protein LCI18_001902 [Fusarium solani-melongenae]|uniref:Uncharacterized protein n=1 Tax=Fusarium solani subsp. cucurbitae TaxID=2747967 RepID=A0ACD3YPU0_FUSSC|nr:hypothetical protein LCI18_001902 [Fusarium solani-melongenae]